MTQPTFRLAMRVEGDKWSAYVASTDSMENATWMGSIAMSIVNDKPERRRAFIELMKDALGEVLIQHGVKVESWDEQPAPESERAGHA